MRRIVRSQGLRYATPNGKVVTMVPRHRLHILFVDDEEDVVNVTVPMLEGLGHSVRGETESLNALRRFSEEPEQFDLAILDYVMPELTGLELAQRFRRIRPGFPVLLYARHRDRPSTEKLEAAGIGRFIVKPATSVALGGMLRKVLTR